MNGRRLTDAQISAGLRAHLPDRAYQGLRERVLDAAETTSQQRALPSFFGALSQADPVARRRSILIAAALLVALAAATAAAVGSLRLLQRDPLRNLNFEPPTDVPAFVLSSHDRMSQLPPVAMTWLRDGSTKDRIYVDRSGAVRMELYASAEATEPEAYRILSGNTMASLVTVGSQKVWVVQDGAIGEDPRGYILSTIGSGPFAFDGAGCELSRDAGQDGNVTAASGWRYTGVEDIAGRPADHFACGGGDLWLDIETRLIMRARAPMLDDAGQPIPGQFRTIEVTDIAFGEQPAALFDLAAPTGIAAMPSEQYAALCSGGETMAPPLDPPPCAGTSRPAEVTPTPQPEPSPTPTVRPDPSDCAIPSPKPGEPTGPLAWTQASLKHDWPAPVRPEPAGAASVIPMPPTYIDPSGDTGSDDVPCVDIRDLTVGTYGVSLNLVANPPPGVDPSKVWIAYGVAVDDDGDGVPDWRYGIDNMALTPGDTEGYHRAWRTDLHTGRTESDSGRIDRPHRGEDAESVGTTYFSTSYPAGPSGADPGWTMAFSFGKVSDTTAGEVTYGVKLDKPFYTWASVIVDGRVIATDYAPDTGWLLPSPRANPGGTYVLPRDANGLPFRLSMSVPKGWTAPGSDSQVSDGRPWGDSVGLEFMIIDKPGLNACGSRGTALATIGPGVDALVTFLARQPEIKVSQSTDLTLDGYSGRYLEYTTTDQDDCDSDNRPFWPVITDSGEGRDYNQVWILDVDGVRLVIDGFAPKASETVKAELRQIVQSIHIGP
jgi:hypothetical protein